MFGFLGNIFGNIKSWLAVAGVIAIAVLVGLWKSAVAKLHSERAERSDEDRIREATARKVERASSEILVEGLENESRANAEIIDPTNRDHFS